MPHVACTRCGRSARPARVALVGGRCPLCRRPLGGRAGIAPADAVARRLELARAELDMEVAVLSEVADGAEVVRALAGRAPGLGLRIGTSAPLEDTVCRQLLEGRSRGLYPDVLEDPELRRLAGVRGSGLRAYLGVPLTPEDGRRYVLCCLARERRPDLGEADLRFLAGVGEGLAADLAAPPYAYLRGMYD